VSFLILAAIAGYGLNQLFQRFLHQPARMVDAFPKAQLFESSLPQATGKTVADMMVTLLEVTVGRRMGCPG
jgi:hypothetical protein